LNTVVFATLTSTLPTVTLVKYQDVFWDTKVLVLLKKSLLMLKVLKSVTVSALLGSLRDVVLANIVQLAVKLFAVQ